MKTQNLPLTIPLFPLPIVAFPNAFVPLHIFEERYKKMINDAMLLDGHFGIVRSDGGRLAKVGCLVEIVAVQPLALGQMNIVTEGRCRFAIDSLRGDRPYRQAQVHILEEQKELGDSSSLANAIRSAVKDIGRLSNKVLSSEVDFEQDLPAEPLELSFWVPVRILGSPTQQQKLLEIDELDKRLETELAILDVMRKQLAAKAAIEDAFS